MIAPLDVDHPEISKGAAQVPCFLLFVSAARQLIDDDGDNSGALVSRHGLSRGGALWFVDLTQRDRSLALPLGAAALTYTNLELGFGGAPAGTLPARARGVLQLALLIGLPAIAHQPAGIFAYWLPAASFGTAQLLLFRHSAIVRRVIGLPPVRAVGSTAPK